MIVGVALAAMMWMGETRMTMALAGAACEAAGMIQQRKLSRRHRALVAFMTLAISALLGVPTLGFGWVTPTAPRNFWGWWRWGLPPAANS